MDILLDSNGDLAFKGTDIVLANSVRQKIKIRLKWFFQEWRWDDEAGVPYFEYLFVKNPDIDQIKELVEEQIFNVDEIISSYYRGYIFCINKRCSVQFYKCVR